jgi:hypothetical protein
MPILKQVYTDPEKLVEDLDPHDKIWIAPPGIAYPQNPDYGNLYPQAIRHLTAAALLYELIDHSTGVKPRIITTGGFHKGEGILSQNARNYLMFEKGICSMDINQIQELVPDAEPHNSIEELEALEKATRISEENPHIIIPDSISQLPRYFLHAIHGIKLSKVSFLAIPFHWNDYHVLECVREVPLIFYTLFDPGWQGDFGKYVRRKTEETRMKE